jgi:4'-phosphopantetheinyl transferase EntD
MNVIATPWPDRCLVVTAPIKPSRADAWFSEAEREQANTFKLPKRRAEWLLVRAAAKQLALQLGITNDPRTLTVERPLTAGWYVSLSHSGNYAGAAFAREPIGLDVQVVREIAEWSTHLFLSDAETEEMRTCAIEHRVLHFWCAKEAAFKRAADYETMKQLPLTLIEQRGDGLLFDKVETVRIGELIVALTRPTR